MRIVIKVGTSTLAHATGRMNIRRVEALCKVLSDLKNAGHEIILVSSGAIGMGVGKLSLKERPRDIPGERIREALIAEGVPLDKPCDGYWAELRDTEGELVVTKGDFVAIRPKEQSDMKDRMHLV